MRKKSSNVKKKDNNNDRNCELECGTLFEVRELLIRMYQFFQCSISKSEKNIFRKTYDNNQISSIMITKRITINLEL